MREFRHKGFARKKAGDILRTEKLFDDSQIMFHKFYLDNWEAQSVKVGCSERDDVSPICSCLTCYISFLWVTLVKIEIAPTLAMIKGSFRNSAPLPIHAKSFKASSVFMP